MNFAGTMEVTILSGFMIGRRMAATPRREIYGPRNDAG